MRHSDNHWAGDSIRRSGFYSTGMRRVHSSLCMTLALCALFNLLTPYVFAGEITNKVTLAFQVIRNPDSVFDGDNIDNQWELDQFGSLLTATDISDYDGDFFLDWDEYQAGTDPKDPNSLLQISDIRQMPNGTVRVIWDSSTNPDPAWRSYDLYYAESLNELTTGGIPVALSVPSEGSSTTNLSTSASDGSRHRFYKLQLHK